MKICVDNDKCTAHGVCEEIAPEIFEVQDDGSLLILEENPSEEFRGRLQEAVNACPADAIRIED